MDLRLLQGPRVVETMDFAMGPGEPGEMRSRNGLSPVAIQSGGYCT